MLKKIFKSKNELNKTYSSKGGELDLQKYNAYLKKNVALLEQLNTSIESLIKWSKNLNYITLFDSDIDGDGKGVLEYKVLNKTNLYFISFDDKNNVFGVYVNNIINTTNNWIIDPNSFTFSLIRNGKVKNKKYNIKDGEGDNSFCLCLNYDHLYYFGYGDGSGNDIRLPKIGLKEMYYPCKPIRYEYNGEKQPLQDSTKDFTIQRLIVLEMNKF